MTLITTDSDTGLAKDLTLKGKVTAMTLLTVTQD